MPPYLPFWKEVQAALAQHGVTTAQAREKNWIRVPVPGGTAYGGGVHFSAAFKRGGEFAIELTIQLPANESAAVFELVQTHKLELQDRFGKLEWYASPGNNRRLIVLHSGLNKSETSEDEFLGWLMSKAPPFFGAISPLLR